MDDQAAGKVEAFIHRWRGATGSELANYQLFLGELVELLDLPRPDPAREDTRDNAYVFERRIVFKHGDGSESAGRIDLYRRAHFVCEAKKVKLTVATKGFDDALQRARGQAEGYARALPAEEGRPPFLIVVDVGHVIELYSEFSRSGATYTPFPDPRSHRIALDELRKPEIRERLRAVWLEPMSLDPTRQSARVTREIAARLAEIAKALEADGHEAEAVAGFLSRCLFTFFAEDVELIPKDSFRELLKSIRNQPGQFVPIVTELWRAMDAGDFSVALKADLLQFNGKLFKQPVVLPLKRDQIDLLIAAAEAKWSEVEPAIFGTLLERALDPDERHALGAHYTPRAYVERLVLPTVIEPLREDWAHAHAAALTLAREGDIPGALAEVKAFHKALCAVRVLDPACGSGNFLYVTLEHLKRLEGEVLNAFDELDPDRQQGKLRQGGLALDATRANPFGAETVDPHQLLGIELNPRAAAIAEMVLWIGYLQWHFRTLAGKPAEPVLRDFHNIECRDAVLAYDRVEYVTDERGVPVTRWDGKTMKPSPVTGEPVPDEAAQVPVERYVNPTRAEWPQADFVVGNPPFIGNKRMRLALGDGYVEALRSTWDDVPETADFVMYWWHQAAWLTRRGWLRRFGLITTNSLRQTFNRCVVEMHMQWEDRGPPPRYAPGMVPPGEVAVPLAPPLSIAFAIPDHPWVDSADGADVRIAMTVAATTVGPGSLNEAVQELAQDDGSAEVRLVRRVGPIHADLRIGADIGLAVQMGANAGISFMGMIPLGEAFWVTPAEASAIPPDVVRSLDSRLRRYVNGRDLLYAPRGIYALDFYGLELEAVRARYPWAYQRLFNSVRLGRAKDKRKSYRENWWTFAEARPALRKALSGLNRYIGTTETATHRVFSFIDATFLPDQKIRVVASDSLALLAVLTSRVHVAWALVAGSRLGVGNDPVYNNARCFEQFPFPDMALISEGGAPDFARRIVSHRASQQAQHGGLTVTGIYNVLEKLRRNEVLGSKDKLIHEQGLVSVLRELHDELDRAVFGAYGWNDLADKLVGRPGATTPWPEKPPEQAEAEEELLTRLVALNAERAAEEKRGLVRWLRPEFQNPQGTKPPSQDEIDTDADEPAPVVAKLDKKIPWPKSAAEQARAVADALVAARCPLTHDELAARFSGKGAWKKRLPPLLETLVAVGRARDTGAGFVAA